MLRFQTSDIADAGEAARCKAIPGLRVQAAPYQMLDARQATQMDGITDIPDDPNRIVVGNTRTPRLAYPACHLCTVRETKGNCVPGIVAVEIEVCDKVDRHRLLPVRTRGWTGAPQRFQRVSVVYRSIIARQNPLKRWNRRAEVNADEGEEAVASLALMQDR